MKSKVNSQIIKGIVFYGSMVMILLGQMPNIPIHKWTNSKPISTPKTKILS